MAGIAVVIADDEQPAGVQIKAVDMTVGPNQVGGDSVREIEDVKSFVDKQCAASSRPR